MPYSDDNPEPLYITEGSPLTPLTVTGNMYDFKHMTFKDVPVLTFPRDFDPSKTTIAAWRTMFPAHLDSAICFRNMMDSKQVFKDMEDKRGTMFDFTLNGGNEPLSVYSIDRPCGFVTATYSIMPQMINLSGKTKSTLNLPNSGNDDAQAFHWKTDQSGSVETIGGPDHEDAIVVRGFGDSDIDTENHTFSRELLCQKPLFDAFAVTLYVKKNDYVYKDAPSVEFKIYGDDSQNSQTDSIRIEYSYNSDIQIRVNGEENKVSGPLAFAQEGLKTNVMVENSEFKDNQDAHVFYCYPTFNRVVVTGDLVTDRTQTAKSVVCIKNSRASLGDSVTPSMEEFPAAHKAGKANSMRISNAGMYFRMPGRMKVSVHNCEVSFAVTAMRFFPVLEFSYMYRLPGNCSKTNFDGVPSLGSVSYSDYFVLEVGGALDSYTGYDNRFYSSFIYYDSESDTSVFCANFKIYGKNIYDNYYKAQVRPIEILGMVHIGRRSGKLADLRSDDGSFASGFKANLSGQRLSTYMSGSGVSIGSSWEDYITSLNVTHSESGTSGTITLDRAMMMPHLSRVLRQSIGAVSLVARNGYYDVNTSQGGFSNSIYGMTPGLVFKGYAIQEDMGDNSDNADISVTLMGIQKKLSDMKLVNCPYWDGDQVFENGSDGVLNYFISYTGCRLVYDRRLSAGTQGGDSELGGAASNFILPRSISLNAPAVHFAMGTPVLDAIREIAKMINHEFIVQPDGKGYFYGLDRYGVPTWVRNGPVRKVYRESEIISLNIQPYLENRYNTFLTVALKGRPDPKSGQLVPDGVAIQSKLSENRRGDSAEYPWSRIITNRENGILTKRELTMHHRRNVIFGSTMMFLGNITVPGYHDFFLLDKIGIQDDTGSTTYFYISQIGQNLNLSSKEWTTTLSITYI